MTNTSWASQFPSSPRFKTINELLASLPRWFHPVAVARSTGRCSQYITGSVYIVQTSDLNMQNALDSLLQIQDSIRVRCARNTRNDAAMNGVASSVLPPTQGTDQREYLRRLTGTEATAVVKARCKGPSYPRQSWTKRERHAVGAESEAPVERQEEAQNGVTKESLPRPGMYNNCAANETLDEIVMAFPLIDIIIKPPPNKGHMRRRPMHRLLPPNVPGHAEYLLILYHLWNAFPAGLLVIQREESGYLPLTVRLLSSFWSHQQLIERRGV